MSESSKQKWGDLIWRIANNLASKRTWLVAIASVALWDGLIGEASWMVLATIYLSDKVAAGIIAQRVGLKTPPADAPVVEV